MMFHQAAFGALLLSAGINTPSVHAADATIDPASGDVVVEPLVTADETSEPLHAEIGTSNTLIASFSTTEGVKEIEAHIESVKKKGKKVSLKGAKTFTKPRGGRGRAGAKVSSGGGGGRGGRKGGGRYLSELDDTPTIGYTVIEVGDPNSETEAEALSALTGVAYVEHDWDETVDELTEEQYEQYNLRGGPRKHVKDMMESMAMEQDNLHRKLAEETPFGIEMVNIQHLWSLDTTYEHVKICVVDTGYDLGHPDLPSNNVTGWDPTTGSYANGLWYVDGHSHGTHCAGTIGAIGGNDEGVVGVNPNPSRFSFHIGKGLSDGGSGSGTDVLAAVNDCVANGARVISMSLGSSSYSQTADNTYQEVYDSGVLIIAAAGNSGSDVMHYPSGYKSVMSVASVTEGSGAGTATYGQLSSFSTRNEQTEIAGPGSHVKSTVPRDKGSYGTKSGTSMACPHVAGVAALLISLFPTCTNNQIRNAMINSASEPPAYAVDNRNTAGWDKYYGWGIVDAGAAHALLSQGCDVAGGLASIVDGDLSEMALGGKDQKQIGCTLDSHCADDNLCLGVQLCNTTSNTCYVQENTVPDCDDGVKCTIDTCNPSLYDGQSPTSMCIHTQMTCDDDNLCNGISTCHEDVGQCVQDVAPVVCDDNSECTLDSCTTSTGQCVFETKNCDDGNACTVGDYCDVDVGCVYANPLDNCCGNHQCEADAGENMASCSKDCSTSISTPIHVVPSAFWDYAGLYMNLESKAVPMSITGLGMHCLLPEGKVGQLHVWEKTGNHYDDGAWYNSNKWNKIIDNQNVTCNGAGALTNIYFDEAVSIPAASRHALHVFVNTDDLDNDYPTMRGIRYNWCDGGGQQEPYTEDNYLVIRAGGGNRCKTMWCYMSSPIVFSGDVFYAPGALSDPPEGSTPSPQASGGEITSASPSRKPTPFPVVPPTDQPTEALDVCLTGSVASHGFSATTNLTSTPFSLSGDPENAWRIDTGSGCDGSMDRLLAGLDVSGSGTNSKLTIDIPADAVSVSFYYSYPKTLLVSQGDQFHVGWVSGTDTDIKQYEAGLGGLEETCAKDCLEIPDGASALELTCIAEAQEWCSVDNLEFHSAAPTLSPTTASPTDPPSETPTDSPTDEPTTANPTLSPSVDPTKAPSYSPTVSPSESIAPTMFVPEEVSLLAPETGSCYIVRAHFFEVTAGEKWAKLTDLAIHSYDTRGLQVYVKQESPETGTAATPFEKTPCEWVRIAETVPSWRGYYNKNHFPTWSYFDPVIIAPHTSLAIHIVQTSGYGMCMSRGSYKAASYDAVWQSLPSTSVVGAVSMSWSKQGSYNINEPFQQGSKTYPYSFRGGVKLETIKPGTESHSPTMAPTESTIPGTISKEGVASSGLVNGVQFDVHNLGSDDIIVNKLGIPLSGSGKVDVWMKDGTHTGSSGSCENQNNWCGSWKKLLSRKAMSGSSGSLVDTSTFVAIAKANAVTSFVVVSDNPILEKGAATADTDLVTNGDLAIKPASPVEDYYGDNVQTSHTLPIPSATFNININYDIARSVCAVNSKASWVVLNPDLSAYGTDSLGAAADDEGTGADDGEIYHGHGDELIELPASDEDGGGGLMNEGAPVEEMIE